MAAKGMVLIERQRCKGCWLCIDVCPTGSLETDDQLNAKGYQPARMKEISEGEKGCTGCASCAMICPETAIEVYREAR